MLPETRLLPPEAPIPDGWKPLVDFIMPDGEHKDVHAVVKGFGARVPDEIYASIRTNMARGLPALPGRAPAHSRAMVLCCYGPSLADTWRLAAATPGDLWTVSGAHHFMLGKGVKPAFHTDVDPRDHKAKFVEAPTCDSTHFYIPSRASPRYFDNLRDRNVTLYHLRCKDEVSTITAIDPKAYICRSAITAGLCAVMLGTILGYREFHLFGMDGCATDGRKYLGEHPNAAEPFDCLVEIHGRTFATNMLMLLALNDFFAIATQWPMGSFHFYGDGMLAWAEKMARTPLEQRG